MQLPLPPIVCVLLATALLPCGARAVDLQDPDLGQDIVVRCHYHMGEFGAAGIRACVNGERAALSALQDYPEAAKSIVSRCAERFESSGWGRVKQCADREIEAQGAATGD